MKLGKHTNTALKDVAGYNAGMTKSLLDKIFMADKVGDSRLFIDYGCADGAMIELLSTIFPDCFFIGYDENPAMMIASTKRFKYFPVEGDFAPCEKGWTSGANFNLRFTTDWDEVRRVVKLNEASSIKMKSCLILSSIIHELYAYKRDQIDQLWKQIWELKADYISIRDMMVSDTASRPSDAVSVARIRQRYESEPLRAFESCWGSLNDNWSLTHFLLKYRYVNEWERELRENYLPISLERLLGLVPTEYAPIFLEHNTLPFLRERVMEDFGIQLQERTHCKLILKKT